MEPDKIYMSCDYCEGKGETYSDKLMVETGDGIRTCTRCKGLGVVALQDLSINEITNYMSEYAVDDNRIHKDILLRALIELFIQR